MEGTLLPPPGGSYHPIDEAKEGDKNRVASRRTTPRWGPLQKLNSTDGLPNEWNRKRTPSGLEWEADDADLVIFRENQLLLEDENPKGERTDQRISPGTAAEQSKMQNAKLSTKLAQMPAPCESMQEEHRARGRGARGQGRQASDRVSIPDTDGGFNSICKNDWARSWA